MEVVLEDAGKEGGREGGRGGMKYLYEKRGWCGQSREEGREGGRGDVPAL